MLVDRHTRTLYTDPGSPAHTKTPDSAQVGTSICSVRWYNYRYIYIYISTFSRPRQQMHGMHRLVAMQTENAELHAVQPKVCGARDLITFPSPEAQHEEYTMGQQDLLHRGARLHNHMLSLPSRTAVAGRWRKRFLL